MRPTGPRVPVQRSAGAGRRFVPGVGVLAVAVVAAVAVLAPMPMSGAGFSYRTEATGNTLQADTLAAPTGLGATPGCVSAAVPTVVGSHSAAKATTVDLQVPAAAAAGDLLIAHLVNDNTSSTPAGWSLLHDVTDPANLQSRLYQRVATPSDPGTTHSFTVTGNKSAGSLVVVRGATGPVALADAAGTANGSTVNVVAPSLTSTRANTLLLTFHGVKQAGVTFSTPAGMTEVYDFGPSGVSLAGDREARASAGATGTRTAVASASATAIGQSVLVLPPLLPRVALAWTATTSSWSTGYEVLRSGSVVANLSPRSTVAWTDTAPDQGEQQYAVRAVAETWRSAPATAVATVGCP